MKPRVLVVEDDFETARNLVRVLSKKGYDVQHAEDGEAALNAYRGFKPRVMLVDATLPRRTGLDLGRDVRAQDGGQTIGLVMISSSFKSGTIEQSALAAGFDAVFPKPIPVIDLLNKIDDLVENGRPQPAEKKTPSTPPTPAARAPEPRPAQRDKARSTSSPAIPIPQKPLPRAEPSTKPGSTEGAPVVEAPRPRTNPRAVVDPLARLPAEAAPLGDERTGLSLLVEAARARATGVLRLREKRAILEVAVKNGVPVGAWDNLRENRLVERLLRSGRLAPTRVPHIEARMRESGERFVESCLALGVLDESTALDALAAQEEARVEAALLTTTGSAQFVRDPAAVGDLAHGAFDLVERALTAHLRRPDDAAANALRARHAHTVFVPNAGLEEQLSSIARACPSSTLPQLFLAGRAMIADVELCGEHAVSELVLWLALGLARDERAPAEPRALPVLLRSEREQVAFDVEAARVVRETYLKWQGRTHYDVLGVDPDCTLDDVRDATTARHETVGRTAFVGRDLGPAQGIHRELVAMIDHASEVLRDEEERAAYDLAAEGALSLPRANAGHALEEEILQGRIYLADGNVPSAHDAFLRACALAPDDADAVAYLGYTTFLAKHDLERARAILESAVDMNPLATRPVLYLGLIAASEGRVDHAREHFLRAARRAPEDQEVLAALAALEGS